MKLNLFIFLSFGNMLKCCYTRNSDNGLRNEFHMDEHELPHSQSDSRCASTDNQRSTVRTSFGVVYGKTVTLCDVPGPTFQERPESRVGTVRVFLGIPYADPPVKSRKYKPPHPSTFHGEINALHLKPSCPQNKKYIGYDKGINNTDEDCLYLNIYTPNMPFSGSYSNYSVILYIHGGYFDHGSANLFPAHMLATQGVVVVTFNYRLGHLGFLSTGDGASVGNYGLLDQLFALRWVYEHINNFGGDKTSITLFGTDAGAVSASLLAISSHSRYMVKRIIALNGSPLADWGTIINRHFAVNTSHVLGGALGCTIDDSYKLVACLSTRTNNEYKQLDVKPRTGWLPWGPVVDNFTEMANESFLMKSPEEILEDGITFTSGFTVMTGTSRDEGAFILLDDQLLFQRNFKFSSGTLKQKIKDLQTMYNYSVNSRSIFAAIEYMYEPSLDRFNETVIRHAYISLLSDRFYKAPNYKFVKYLLKNGIKTYQYVFNYSLEGYSFPYSWQACSSQAEYLMISGAPFMDPKYYPPSLNLQSAQWTRADRRMSNFYLQAWTDFAKYGNPTKNSFLNVILWQPATKDNFVSLNLNTTNITADMLRDYRKKECEFWNCYMNFLVHEERPTMMPTLEPGIDELRLVTSALYGGIALGILFFIITVLCCAFYLRKKKCDSY